MAMKMTNYCFFLLVLILFSCQASENLSPEQNFNKIYNESSFSDFEALDVQQLDDGGYIILAVTDNSFSGQVSAPYLLRTDKEGNFLWDTQKTALFKSFLNPVPNFKKKNGEYYFFCKNNADKNMVLVKVNDASQNIEIVRTFDNLKGDLIYVSETPDNGLLLMLLSETCGTDPQPELVKLDANFALQWRKCYAFPINALKDVITQKVNVNYFFSGIFVLNGQVRYFLTLLNPNNTSSILYTDANGNLLGVTQTSLLVNSLTQVVNSQFALTFVRQRDLNIVPKITFNITANESPAIFGNTFHEINSEKRILAKKMTLGGKEVVIFASTLENIPVRIYAFDPTTEILLGTLTLGRVNPYEIANIIPTADGGLAIVVNTLVADRFKRIGLLKVSPKEAANLVK